MNYIAVAALLGWLPLVVLLFSAFPPKKLVPYLYVFAWLFLPEGGFSLPGLPDYTKMSGTGVGIVLSAFLFDSGRLLALRPRWFDLPVIAFCFGQAATAFSNGLTTWDAMAMTVGELINWGLPYLVGRAYLTDAEAFADFALAMTLGGLIYVPLCLIEMRVMSPVFSRTLYGIEFWESTRYGAYRPRVFLSLGLALGAYMMNAGLTAYILWSSGKVERIRNVSFTLLTFGLLLTAVLCRSTGATILMFAGMATYWAVKRTRKAVFIWLLIAVAPAYCTVRTLNLWSGQEVVDFFNHNLDQERGGSLQYRLEMERLLADKAQERPIFGWGGYNRFQVTDKTGKVVTVPDGYWIIVLGMQGLVGLVSLLAMFLLPMARTIRRFPPSTWDDPRVAPMVALGLALVLMMLDCLSNAMLMPLYPFAIGGLMTCPEFQLGGAGDAGDALDAGHELATAGRLGEAARDYQKAIEQSSGRGDPESLAIQAEARDGIGRWHLADGRLREAAGSFREALVLRDQLAGTSPEPDRFRDLAIARDALARAFAEMGDTDGAIEERRIALEIWDALASAHPENVGYRDGRADALNDLSWLLATSPGGSDRDPARALALAEEAVRIAPTHGASWNTLGVARYRAGDFAGAIEALERSTFTGAEPGGTAFDHYFLAMAWCRIDREDTAGEWLERGAKWAARHRPGHPDLARFRQEAESLIRIATGDRWA